MKKSQIKRFAIKALTLPELLIAISVFSLVGLAFYTFSMHALRSFTWLTATNVAHQSARNGVQRMLRDIHDSPSPLMLLNVSGETAPAADTYWGVLFQRMIHGPLQVTSNLVLNSTTMNVLTGSVFVPEVGQLVCLPNSNNLYRITSVAKSGNTSTLTISPGIQSSDVLSASGTYSSNGSDGGSEVIAVYLVQRCAYLVRPAVNDTLELRYYPAVQPWTGASKPAGLLWGDNGTTATGDDLYYYVPPKTNQNSNTNTLPHPGTYPDTFQVVSRGLRGMMVSGQSVGPFNSPITSGGAPNRRAVAAVQLALQDNKVSNLVEGGTSPHRLNATTLFLNAVIPQRHLLTNRN